MKPGPHKPSPRGKPKRPAPLGRVSVKRRPGPQPDKPCPDPDCYVVGIGASAGGLQTLERFFAAMPPEPNMTFVVISHLEPSHVSLLPGEHARSPCP